MSVLHHLKTLKIAAVCSMFIIKQYTESPSKILWSACWMYLLNLSLTCHFATLLFQSFLLKYLHFFIQNFHKVRKVEGIMSAECSSQVISPLQLIHWWCNYFSGHHWIYVTSSASVEHLWSSPSGSISSIFFNTLMKLPTSFAFTVYFIVLRKYNWNRCKFCHLYICIIAGKVDDHARTQRHRSRKVGLFSAGSHTLADYPRHPGSW